MRGDKLELLNDDSAFERDDLRLLVKPVKRGFLSVQFVALESKVVRGFQRGGIFCEFAANADWVQLNFSVRILFDLFEVREQRTACGDAELGFASASAEGVNELEF